MRYPSIYKNAKQLALANGQIYHIAAILWRKRTPISIGVNTSQTHPLFKGYRTETRHAETCVLPLAKKGDIIEILRWTLDGVCAPIEPCRICCMQIRKRGLKVRLCL